MYLARVPLAVLVTLGLAGCGPSIDDDQTGSGSGSGTDPSTSGTTTGPTTQSTSEVTTGPCLEPETCLSTAPCLFDVPPPTTMPDTETATGTTESGTDTDTDTDTDTSTSTGGTTGGDTTTTGPCLAPGAAVPDAPSPRPTSEVERSGDEVAPSRRALVDRLETQQVLPADVVERLRRRSR